SVEGHVQFNAPTIYQGTAFDSVRLAFSKGKVVEASANNTGRLNAILNSDEGARYIGEFALGFNPYIQEPMRDILFDEKIAGSFHFTPGQAYEECGNGNKSQVHWDMVCIQRPEHGGGEMRFDGKLVRKDGLFVPRALPKTETHLHIEGALPYELLRELAPETYEADPPFRRRSHRYPSFPDFERTLLNHALPWFTSAERYHE